VSEAKVEPTTEGKGSDSGNNEVITAPISWLRQVALEIEAKKGNPNHGGTRQSQVEGTLTLSTYTMSESTGKLQQKDYTPEVDALIPQATTLAKVGLPRLLVSS
jgi:hypothetical protein